MANHEQPEDGGWAAYLTQLADEFRGKSAMVAHDFREQTTDILARSGQWEPEDVDRFQEYQKGNPWLPLMWTEKTGYIIVGQERVPVEKMDSTPQYQDFEHQFLVARGLFWGIGVIVWQDRHPGPRWSAVAGVLRPGAAGPYSDHEQGRFRQEAAFMLHFIQVHPWLKRVTA